MEDFNSEIIINNNKNNSIKEKKKIYIKLNLKKK